MRTWSWSQVFGIWLHGEPLVWGLSLAALFHCLEPELKMAQLFKSEPFTSSSSSTTTTAATGM